ncbi:MAG: hypothetical protein Q8K92_13375 [Leadbetterella sp.]|nr:hypothetical protein [Leadbetterella sp.]
MNVWRLHIKSAAESGQNPQEFCVSNNIAGIGWPVNTKREKLNKTQFEKLCRSEYGKLPGAVNAMVYRIVEGDYIWTRNKNQDYFLGKIASDWEFNNSQEFKDNDVVNHRKVAEWKKIGKLSEIPGKVVSAFRATSALQQIDSDAIRLISDYIWNGIRSETINQKLDFFDLIGDEALEDLVGIYLQMEEDYMIVPSTCKSDTALYEFSLIHRKTGKNAYLQVKSGHSFADLNKMLENEAKVYYFQKHKEERSEYEKLIHISEAEIWEFIKNHQAILPENIKVWLNFCNHN